MIRSSFAIQRRFHPGRAVRTEQPDLILTGLQSDDSGYGQAGVIMAELLGLPHATIVIEVDASGEKLRVKRELENAGINGMQCPHRRCSRSIRNQPDRYASLRASWPRRKRRLGSNARGDSSRSPHQHRKDLSSREDQADSVSWWWRRSGQWRWRKSFILKHE
jgi:electron transfer flavoprotein beta subunit